MYFSTAANILLSVIISVPWTIGLTVKPAIIIATANMADNILEVQDLTKYYGKINDILKSKTESIFDIKKLLYY